MNAIMESDKLNDIRVISNAKSQDMNLPILPVVVFNPIAQKGNIYYALWDTGANSCCITEKVVNDLGLKPIKQGVVSSVNENTYQDVYNVNFLFQKQFYEQDVIVENIEVTTFQSSFRKFDIIIGTNIFSLGKLSFEVKDDTLHFYFRFK